ncbi:DUF6630 family protein [Aeoliella mucimassa]|uniref:DUF6630 domain-containing protein n=1 Tax=Aeoliella mucimassa TaxID=2527972 RepID=A0A518ATB1_9BACT|nr:hypothetical protein [Aeoliella mucimassa]QDU57946.1 hypothetical protein Pan181_41700 [Aeoliella mucimassa]
MSELPQLSRLSNIDRRHWLSSKQALTALQALGERQAITWLRQQFTSPADLEWGRLLRDLNPTWEELTLWIRGDKEHCLVGIDALAEFTPHPNTNDPTKPVLPTGATTELINTAIDQALAKYANPRLEKTVARIHRVWPKHRSPKKNITIPRWLQSVAEALAENDSQVVRGWHKKLLTSVDAPKSEDDFWFALIECLSENNIVAVVDWREFTDAIVESLQSLRSARNIDLDWETLKSFDGDNEVFFRHVSGLVGKTGRSLVSFDTGGDEYALTFMPTNHIPKYHEVLTSNLTWSSGVTKFD